MTVRSKKIGTTGSSSDASTTKKVPRSKRITMQPKKKEDFVSKTGVVVIENYCRKCMKMKSPDDFYMAVDDGLIDSNGLFSVCKDCCNGLFNHFHDIYNSVPKAILQTCRTINLRYDENAVGFTMSHLSQMMEKDKDVKNIFGIYKAKLAQSQKGLISQKDPHEVFTFVEPKANVISDPLDDSEESHDLIDYWGENFERDEYIWLESELDAWKRTHKCDTKGEEELLKEICHKKLEIRNARRDGKSTAGLVKEYQELMKTANVDPGKTALANSGKAKENMSDFISIIEQNEPAEYFQDKTLFKDFDRLDFYFKKYVTRPLKNFITQSRDFNVESESEDDDQWEVEDGDFTPTV